MFRSFTLHPSGCSSTTSHVSMTFPSLSSTFSPWGSAGISVGWTQRFAARSSQPIHGGSSVHTKCQGGCSKLLPSLNRGSTGSLSVAIATNRGVFIGLSWRHALDRWRNFTYSQIRLVSELDLRSYVTHVNSRCRLRWTLTRVLS